MDTTQINTENTEFNQCYINGYFYSDTDVGDDTTQLFEIILKWNTKQLIIK